MFAQGFPHRGYLKINSTWVGIEPMSYSHNWFFNQSEGSYDPFIQYFILRLYIKSMSINRTFVRHKSAGGTSLPKKHRDCIWSTTCSLSLHEAV